MDCRSCQTCGAHWMDDQFYWATGKTGKELDLAGLVCNQVEEHRPCSNPLRNHVGGQTWEERQWRLRRMDHLVWAAVDEYRWSLRRFEEDQGAA